MKDQSSPSYKLIFIAAALLLVAGLTSVFFGEYPSDSQIYISDINKKVDRQLNKLILDQNLIEQAILKDSTIRFETLSASYQFPFFIYRNDKMLFWSNNYVVPRYHDLAGDYHLKFIQLKEGSYIVRRQSIKKDTIVYNLFSLLPIYQKSQIDNQYIRSGVNEDIFENSNVIIRGGPLKGSKEIKAFDSTYLFSVDLNDDYEVALKYVEYGIVVLTFIALILVCIFLFLWAQLLAKKGKVEYGLLLLIMGFLAIHLLILFINFPFAYLHVDLFNPLYFTTTRFNPSLGNLLINMVFLLIVVFYFFNHYYRSSSFKRILNTRGFSAALVSIILVVISFYALFLELLLLRTLYRDSQWSLDITTSIDFPFLKIICLLIFFISGIVYFLLTHAIFKLVFRVNRGDIIQLATYFSLGAIVYAIASILLGDPYFLVLFLNTLYFVLLKWFDLPRYLVNIRYKTFIYFFVSAFITSALGGFTIRNFEHEKMVDAKQRYANQLLLKNDVLGEFLLSEVLDKIKDDTFVKSRLQSPFLSKEAIEKKIKQIYISSYFDKYDTKVHVFNAKGEPYNVDRNLVNYNLLEFFYNEERYKTDYDNIFFIHDLPNDISKQYISLVSFETSSRTLGYIIIEMKLKKVIPNSLYPQLLIDKRFTQPVVTKNYSYAVYNGDILNENSGDFNYRKNFKYPVWYNSMLFESGLSSKGFHHLGIHEQEDKNIIISSPIEPIRTLLSNFSFLLMIFIFTTIVLFGLFMISSKSTKIQVNFGTRIQLYLNAAFFLPLLVVSISMLSLIGSSYDRDVTTQYFQKARIAGNNLTSVLSRVLVKRVERETLSNELSQLAKHAEVDINLFDISGRLLVTSQPLIYEKNLLSEYINPEAYEGIIELGNSEMIIDEAIGGLFYKTVYVAVKSFDNGEVIGILSIPYFESKDELDMHLIDGLTNIINIFTLIFMVFLIISFLASQILISPLKYIAKKIGRISLTGYNEPIKWKGDDEIGLMVDEYNKMLIKLDESKKALAQTEKESAWREMAQQVAHEIKNPLTPMKLTLQHLKRSFERDDLENKHLIEKPVENLLQQVDTLNDIATSFSAFAKMPIPISERFEMSAVVRETADLYRNDQNTIDVDLIDSPVFVKSDQKLMRRIIGNLIINSLQSAKNGHKPIIKLNLSISEDEKALISVEDNGEGIDESIRNKVFIPNFTTKDEGSGIGLAIAKRGVEHAGGSIWFETNINKGTVFFIELPIAN